MSLTTNGSLGSQETNHGEQLAIKLDCMWKRLGKQNKTKIQLLHANSNFYSHPGFGKKKKSSSEKNSSIFTERFPSVNLRKFNKAGLLLQIQKYTHKKIKK